MRNLGLTAVLILGGLLVPLRAAPDAPVYQPRAWLDSSMGLLQGELTARWGPGQRLRIQRGLAQTARFWRAEDGGAAEFEDFVRAYFTADPAALDTLFGRVAFALERLEGLQHEARRDFRRRLDLDLGPLLPVDGLLAGYEPGAHQAEDFFRDKLAFVVLLNFPLATLEERQRDGAGWDGRQWAQAWLADRFGVRAPGQALQAMAEASAAAEVWLDGCRIRTGLLVDGRGRRLFPSGPRLLAHWGLRDLIRAQYGAGRDGLARQRQLQQVLERIVDQSVPAAALDDPGVDWDPAANRVSRAAGPAPSPDPVPDTRYRVLLDVFHAARELDPWSPLAPTFMARSLGRDRQMPEARVRQALEQVCRSPLLARTARLIRVRLGRRLEPFDLWYDGFRPGSGAGRPALDALARARYPDARAYQKDLPRLLRALGFTPEQAVRLGAGIQVEPARGPGRVLEAGLPSGPCRLRTRIGPEGMDFKAFSVALHGTAHAVAQRLAQDGPEYSLAAGLPSPAFGEALAFLFQDRDLQLLGGPPAGAAQAKALAALDDFWNTCETAGAALVELDVWHWLYDHPDAGPAGLETAVAACARTVWNRYYADAFGRKDALLLAAPGDLAEGRLHLSDYPIGHMVAHQLQRQLESSGSLGGAFQRMALLGRLTPDLWLQRAAGGPLGPGALVQDAQAALEALGK